MEQMQISRIWESFWASLYLLKTLFLSRYVNNVTANKKSKSEAPPVVGAIFGLGRAGSIHLSSIVGNPRIILKYIVDDRSDRFAELRSYWNLDNSVTFLTSDMSEKVYKDKT